MKKILIIIFFMLFACQNINNLKKNNKDNLKDMSDRNLKDLLTYNNKIDLHKNIVDKIYNSIL